jgi:very-short-patch-repair endonuclease
MKSVTGDVCESIDMHDVSFRSPTHSRGIHEEVLARDYNRRKISQFRHIQSVIGLKTDSFAKRRATYDLLKVNKHLTSLVIDVDVFKERYEEIYKKREVEHKNIFIRTSSEHIFEKKFRDSTKSDIFVSPLFGSTTVDFYIPSIGSVIEVDGSFHDREDKMIIDEEKMHLASTLGLQLMSVRNGHVYDFKEHKRDLILENFWKDFNKLPKLNSQQRKLRFCSLILFNVFYHDINFFCEKINISSLRLKELDGVGFNRMAMRYGSKIDLRSSTTKCIRLIY